MSMSRLPVATVYAAFAVCISNCVPQQEANSESTSAEALKGATLEQLASGWKSMARVQPAPPAFMSSIVLHGSNTAEAYTGVARWCRANGGKENFHVRAGECPSYEHPIAGCFGEATWHYRDQHGGSTSTGVCTNPDGTVSAAIMGVDSSDVALYSGAELSAFVEKYVEIGKAQTQSWKDSEEQKKQQEQASFDQAVSALDSSKGAAPAGSPTARESIDFLREKLREGVGRTRLSDFANRMDPNVPATNPCQFTSQSDHQNPTVLELKELDLNVVDTVTSTAEDRYSGHSSDDKVTVFHVKLATKSGVGFADFRDTDTAKRCAKAFVALAQRCGAKQDNRFK